MGNDSNIQLPGTSDTSGSKIHAWDKGGSLGKEQYVVPSSPENISFIGYTTTFRMVGRNGTSRPLGAIFNDTASPLLVRVSEISVAMDATVAPTPPGLLFRLARLTTLPTGGTALTKVGVDSGQTSDTHVKLFGDASADGTNSASALTFPSPGGPFKQAFGGRFQATPDFGHVPTSLIQLISEDVLLRAVEGIGLYAIGVAGSDPATNHYIVNFGHREFTL